MAERRRFVRVGAVWILAMLLVCGVAAAQTVLGRVAGTVLDASGGVLPGATVTLTNVSTNQTSTVVTSGVGGFVFPQVPAGTYKVVVELQGFKTATYSQVAVSVGQEYSLTARLELGQLSETVEVVTGVSLVKTTTPEVSTTVTQKEVLSLPLSGRDVTGLIRLQAGVPGITQRSNTAIDGGRPTWTQVTQDGINVQDNFIRTNSLDFLPNRPTSDNVAEFSVTTSVSGADSAGGATSVRMVTPSGTNAFRGSVFEANRNSDLSANSFFNNKSGVAKPFLNRNQFGGRLGGPVMKDKLFFFGFYEGFRQRQQQAQNNTIPVNADYGTGVFRYAALDGVVRSVNVLQQVGLTLDPKIQSLILSQMPAPSSVNNYDVGDSRSDRLLNTAGYRFNQKRNTDRDYFGFRFDYELSSRNRFEVVFSRLTDVDDRPDLDLITLPRPMVYTSATTKRFVAAWRWLATSRFQNEVRAGFNLAPVGFNSDVKYSGTFFNLPQSLTNREVTFMPQGRYTNTYQFNDSGSFILGSHEFQFGGSLQAIRINPYNYAGQYPTVSTGFSAGVAPSNLQLVSSMFPGGISAADLATANSQLAFQAGIVTSVGQTFQVKDQSSGFVAGIPDSKNYAFNNWASYIQDSWRWKPNFTIRAGLKWEYYSPLREADNLAFLPTMNGSTEKTLLDPNVSVTFVDGDFYKKDLNNFGPTIGFAWDVFKDGRTAVRGGYSLTFVNEETATVARAASTANSGLVTTVSSTGLYTYVNNGVPVVATPAFKSTRTMPDQLALSLSGTVMGIDPELAQPHVHQVSVGISRQLPWAFAAEARYVGTFGRGIWRGIDYNQIDAGGAFLQDFLRARSNGFLALSANGVFDPAYNAAIPGSQPLTVIPNFGGGLLTSATARTAIQQGEVARLADTYVTTAATATQARAAFMDNAGIYAAQAMINGGFSDYNAFQLDLRRQYRNGVAGQVNYTWANTNTNSVGTAQNRVEPFLDSARPELNTGRSEFHMTHVINASLILDLPFGEGRRWLNHGGLADAIIGGWQTSAIIHWQKGSPLSLTSGRGTFNRAGRSGTMTALTSLTQDQLDALFKVTKAANGNIYWIDPAYIDTATGRAVGADNLANAAGFAGQVFFNPMAGEVGNLKILQFDSPAAYSFDAAIAKQFKITKRVRFELKGELLNAFNMVTFAAGDYNVNSTTFGRITGVSVGARVIQVSGRFEF
jgi:hypothetical protein